MLEFVAKYAANIHSQNGEDGIIAECLRRVTQLNEVCVEIGGNDGMWLSNTRLLIEQGWTGTFVEADLKLHQKCIENWAHNPKVSCRRAKVTSRNINEFVDDRCDVFSTDTDGPDYHIFKGLYVRPKIVIIEIDSSIPPDQLGFNADGGVSYLEMVREALIRSYFLVAHTGNLILLREEYRSLFPDITGNPLVDIDKYFNRSWLPR